MKRLRFQKLAGPAAFWKRAIAYILDVMMLEFFILSPMQNYFSDISPKDASLKEMLNFFVEGNFDIGNLAILVIALLLITLFYWALLEWKIGQSPGKIIMNIFVQPTKNGSSLTLRQCIIRNLSKISLALLFLDTAYMLLRKTNQRWLEEKSNTIVTQKEERIII